MLLTTLGANLLENLLAGRWVYTERQGNEVIRAGERTIRAGQDF